MAAIQPTSVTIVGEWDATAGYYHPVVTLATSGSGAALSVGSYTFSNTAGTGELVVVVT